MPIAIEIEITIPPKNIVTYREELEIKDLDSYLVIQYKK